MSDVEFYRDHIDGLRSQLLLRDRKIEQLQNAVTACVRERGAFHQIYQRLISLDWKVPLDSPINAELAGIVDDMGRVLREGDL